jgi:hypothetical protein
MKKEIVKMLKNFDALLNASELDTLVDDLLPKDYRVYSDGAPIKGHKKLMAFYKPSCGSDVKSVLKGPVELIAPNVAVFTVAYSNKHGSGHTVTFARKEASEWKLACDVVID